MQRVILKKKRKALNTTKNQLLAWSKKFDSVAWFTSNAYQQNHSEFEALLAVGSVSNLVLKTHNDAFKKLEDYQQKTADFLMGYLTYDLKNDVEESLNSNNKDFLNFPELVFFQPQKIWILKNGYIEGHYLESEKEELEVDFESICNTEPEESNENRTPVTCTPKLSKEAYYQKIEKIQDYIQQGEVYELNFCQEYFSKETEIEPFEVYEKLNNVTKAPFSSFLKWDKKYLISASPERFLKKKNTTLLSQPIKGTQRRSKNDKEDNRLKKILKTDQKELAENSMIVDLVRNDLSKIALPNSVKVDEFCKIYTFEQAHQMISTVSCSVSEHCSLEKILKSTFPMGSMTGAPKVAALKMIEALEISKRGLFSGAVGYFTPEGDFDLNVVIRSILYNSLTRYVSYSVGGAITAKSEVSKEYEECLLKGEMLKKSLL